MHAIAPILLFSTVIALYGYVLQGDKKEETQGIVESEFEGLPNEMNEMPLQMEVLGDELQYDYERVREAFEEARNSRQKRCSGANVPCEFENAHCCSGLECQETFGYGWWYKSPYCMPKVVPHNRTSC